MACNIRVANFVQLDNLTIVQIDLPVTSNQYKDHVLKVLGNQPLKSENSA